MCPFCLASMGLIVASAASAGGVTALAVKLSQRKNLGHEVTPNPSESSTIGQDRRVGLAGIAASRLRPASKAQRMLTRTRIHRIDRQSRDEIEGYHLTRLGKTIIAPVGSMCRWVKRYHRKATADVHLPEAYEGQ